MFKRIAVALIATTMFAAPVLAATGNVQPTTAVAAASANGSDQGTVGARSEPGKPGVGMHKGRHGHRHIARRGECFGKHFGRHHGRHHGKWYVRHHGKHGHKAGLAKHLPKPAKSHKRLPA